MGVGDIVYNAAGGAATASGGGAAIRISGNTSGTTALVSSGTLTLAGGNNITLSQNGNAITISGPNTTAPITLQQAFPAGLVQNQTFSWGNGQVQVYPFYTPDYITATQVNIPLSVSLSTSSNSSHGGSLSFLFGIYTNNAGTLSSVSSSSMSTAWTNTSNNSSASLQGVRNISIPLNINMTPGQYYIAQVSSTNSVNANWVTLRNYGGGFVNFSGLFGTGFAGNSTTGLALGFGHYSATTAALPTSMSFQEIRNNGQLDPMFWGATFLNTTYP